MAWHPDLDDRFNKCKSQDKIVLKTLILSSNGSIILIASKLIQVEEKNIYNTDKKNYAIRVIEKAFTIVFKYKWVASIMQDRNK